MRLVKVLAQGCLPCVIGVLLIRRGHAGIGAFLCVLGAVLLVVGVLLPRLHSLIDRGMQIFGQWVGIALTWVLLTAMYWFVFVPGRLILRMRRMDPMAREFRTPAVTYWHDRQAHTGEEHFRRQF